MFSVYILLAFVLLVAWRGSRRVALALLPWVVFACSYDAMRLYPNYLVNPIDVRGLYMAEHHLFGVASAEGGVLIPSEYFAQHHWAWVDVVAGICYLCWVPVPLAFALYLYFKKRYALYLRFSLAFLVVNLIGFCGYYIHPAAPPWYAMNYGVTPVLHTPGNVAGLGRFDVLMGIPIFHALYGQNANVFAAVPSLHSAYLLVATAYALIGRCRRCLVVVLGTLCVGIWFTAVYSGHHYLIDVVLGIGTALLGTALVEWLLAHTLVGQRLVEAYASHIRRKPSA